MKKLKIFTLLVLIPFIVFAQKPQQEILELLRLKQWKALMETKLTGFHID